MRKILIVLALICAFGFIPETTKEIKVDIGVASEIQKIIAHSISILDNGTYRNNYDSVKQAINELSSVYQYIDGLKKQALDTTKKK